MNSRLESEEVMTVEVTRIPKKPGGEVNPERNDRIVERWNTTELSMREIGEEFGLSVGSIHRIINTRLEQQRKRALEEAGEVILESDNR